MFSLWAACAAPPEPPPPAPSTTEPQRAVLRKPARRQAKWEQALCNDGTPFSYAIRPGAEPIWVIHLEGGFFCDDERAPCSDRARRLTTTEPGADDSPTKLKAEGVLSLASEQNPRFAAAHQVEAHYCSSDLWLGDQLVRRSTTGDPEQGWFFNGRENVRVLLEAVREIDGLDETDPATRILVVGSSAGALGVAGNLDQFAAAFPKARAEGRLKVVLDGGWIAPIPDGAMMPNGVKWGPIDRACAAAATHPKACVEGPRWWPTAAASGIPVLVAISGQDTTQMGPFGIDTPAERRAWQDAVRRSLEPVPWVFSGGGPYHVVLTDSQRYVRVRPILERFWEGGSPEQIFFDYPDG